MFDLERAIAEWKKTLRRNPAVEDGHIAELEANLRDEVEDLIARGRRLEEAFAQAVKTTGRPQDLEAEYLKARTRRRFGRPSGQPPRFVPALVWNYAKIALRKMRRQKGFSFINIAGLSVGMACCILILLWVKDERSYDRFHDNGDRIYRVLSVDRDGGGDSWDTSSPAPLGETLVRDFPEVLRATRVQSGWSGWNIHRGETGYPESKLAAVDPAFFEIFRFPFVAGDSKTSLRERSSIVLTESLARKFFGDKDALGQTVQMNESDLLVTGVIRDLPRNSHLQFDYAFPLDNMMVWRSSRLDDWTYRQCATYIEMRPGVRIKDFLKKAAGLVQKHEPKSKVELDFQPLAEIHLRSKSLSNFAVQYPNPGNATFVLIFTLTAVCVLLLACVNFMNLSTARYGSRAMEVGVRKLTGATRWDLVRQFLGESILTALVAVGAAVFLVILAFSAFNNLSGKAMVPADLVRLPTILGLLVIALLTGLAAGGYPAAFLSSFAPAKVLKGGVRLGVRRGGVLRKALVVGQFAFTVVLLTATLIIYGQLRYMQNKDLGFDRHNVVSFAGYGAYDDENFASAKQELLRNPDILSVSRCFPPGRGAEGTTAVDWEGKDPGREVMIYSDIGDHDYLRTFGLTMAEGRFYAPEFPTDAENFVLNETAARLIGQGSPLGKKFTFQGRTGTIIGVVRDYYGGSLHIPISPKIIKLENGFFVSVKFRPGSTTAVMEFLTQAWKKFVPNRPFRYDFLDESINNYYKTEYLIGKIFGIFAGLAVLIACLGLFGMAAYTAEQRTKEIGVRKALGAKTSGLVFLLTREFVQWVLLANIIAWPIAYVLGRLWLLNYAYKMTFGPAVFLTASGLSLTIALLTVGYLAWKAAASDPVKCLRYE
jgi:putative ABC transport system permease protein